LAGLFEGNPLMFRFTFSIKDLLWLMVVVGMACCWHMDQKRSKEKQEKLWAICLDTKGANEELRRWNGTLEKIISGPDWGIDEIAVRVETLDLWDLLTKKLNSRRVNKSLDLLLTDLDRQSPGKPNSVIHRSATLNEP
jgi:hypothetical protein